MEKQVYAMVKMDMDAIDEKVKAVIEAHHALRIAIDELGETTRTAESITIKESHPAATGRD